MSLEEIELALPRNAFGPRDRARPGDLWRLFQDAAIVGSARRGWPPERYRAQQCGFVVRSMVARHFRPTRFGDPLVARTWVSSFRRGLVSDRQVRLLIHGELVSAATQRWVHVSLPDLRPARASPELLSAFDILREPDGDVTLPSFTETTASDEHRFSFRCWYTWMDPLAHANHPAYLDWADEGTSRMLAESGRDPHALLGVAEEVTWTNGVVAPEEVTVLTRPAGATDDGATVYRHRILGEDLRVCAEATTIRRHDDG
jgi:acyl-CoA thioesterase FadM